MSTSIKIDLDYIGKYVDSTFYRSMIRSLLYISTGRPHIAFSVGVCARFQSSPKESYLTAVKRILKYLSAIIEYGVWYLKDSNLSLVGYSNVDLADNIDNKKALLEGVFK